LLEILEHIQTGTGRCQQHPIAGLRYGLGSSHGSVQIRNSLGLRTKSTE
jgi:hypothetical protein